MNALPIAIAVATMVIALGFAFVVITRFFRKPPAQHVLIRSGSGGARVSREGIVVFPFLHTSEVLDVSVRTIPIDRRDGKGLSTETDKVELKATFFVSVHPTNDDILLAAREIGCAVANDPEKFRQHVEPKITSALESLARACRAIDIEEKREDFREKLMSIIELGSGLRLDDAALEDIRVVPAGSDHAYR
jgi:uncharacterized membrane protein YqiK